MMQQQRGWVSRRLLPLVIGALLVALVWPARGQEKSSGAISLLPADAAYFSATLRAKEQLDILARSNAWGEFWEMPIIQMGWQHLKKEYSSEEGNLSRLRAFFEEPENKEMLDFLADAGSQEIFSYAGANWLQFQELMGLIPGSQLQILASLIEKGGKAPDPNAGPRGILRALAAHPELIGTPDLIFGFKVSDAKRANKQIDRLESTVVPLLNFFTEIFKDRIKRTKVDDDVFLTVNLDGGMVPWDKIPIKDLAEKEGEFEGVIAKLKDLKLVISLGVKNDYFLIAFGSSADVVKQLGSRGKHLIDRPELKPVADALGKTLTSISYTSQALRAQAALSEKDLNGLVEVARAGLGAADLPEDRRKQILKDVEALVREMSKETVTPGAAVEFTHLTKRGYESFQYDYTKESTLDDSKPLTILDHLGGGPILAAAAREKTSPEDYTRMVKWLKVFYGHADAILQEKLPADQKEKYQKVTREVLPLLERLDDITGKMLIPALADGQAAFVLDAKWTSKHWHKSMKLPQAMPLPEVALVLGVSDAALLKKAAAGYREVLNDAVVKLRELAPKKEDVPEFKIPQPKSRSIKAGETDAGLFWYPMPDDAGVDPQVAPTAGLSERFLVLTLSNGMAERLLASDPLKVDGGPLARKGIAATTYLNFPALLDAAQPWVEGVWVLQVGPPVPGEVEAPKPVAPNKEVVEQIRTGFRILKTFRGATSATYREGDAWVTHSEIIFRDLGARDR
jgi:hypothetical protein